LQNATNAHGLLAKCVVLAGAALGGPVLRGPLDVEIAWTIAAT
jgi:hypothetical protein